MRTVKLRLLELMPLLSIFLDVDNLEEGAGAEYIDRPRVVLCFCTVRYFMSRACAREIFRAALRGRPMSVVLEPRHAPPLSAIAIWLYTLASPLSSQRGVHPSFQKSLNAQACRC